MTVILAPESFEVVECVTQFYRADNGRWVWSCMTCEASSKSWGRPHRGHKLAADAATGAKYHRNAKRMQRQAECYRAWWWRQIMTTSDLDHFMALWRGYFTSSRFEDFEASDIMACVQADDDLWNYMTKMNGGMKCVQQTA